MNKLPLSKNQIGALKTNDPLVTSCFLARETEIKGLKDICKATDISKAVLIRMALEKTYGIVCRDEELHPVNALNKQQKKEINRIIKNNSGLVYT